MNIRTFQKIITTILFVAASITLSATDNSSLTKTASLAYQKGDYKSSIDAYKKIESSGAVSSRLYYNLGNAYYKNGELGEAIFNYERAAKLDPSDQDIKHNLLIANKKKKDDIEQKENYFAQQVQSGVLFLFSLSAWAWISIITLALAMLLYSLFRISNSSGLRKFFFWFGSINFIVCIAALIIGFMAMHEINAQNHAIILSEEVNILNSPAANAKTQFTLHEGTKVKILEISDGWASIALENGNEGWLLTKDIGIF